MRTVLILASAAILACIPGQPGPPGADGAPGASGAIGPAGPMGPKGDPGGGPLLVWRDPSGELAGVGQFLEHHDAAGNWWPISWVTGNIDQVRLKATQVLAVYESGDCSGARYYYAPGPDDEGSVYPGMQIGPPRRPFWVATEGSWHIRLGASQMTRINIGSRDDAAGCAPWSVQSAKVLSVWHAPTVASPPILPTSGPLQLELVSP